MIIKPDICQAFQLYILFLIIRGVAMNQEKAYLIAAAKALSDKHGVDYAILRRRFDLDLPDEVEIDKKMIQLEDKNFDQILEINKRVLTGSYYTPIDLAQHMVKMAFADYMTVTNTLTAKESESFFFSGQVTFDQTKQEALILKISKMKILDPSCGSGIFLKAVYELIHGIYIKFKLKFSKGNIFSQLHGIDIQKNPLTLFKLWCIDEQLKASKDIKMPTIFCGDSITLQSQEKFDLVITNPPYLGEKGNKSLFDHYKHLEGYEGRMDLFYFFIYKGLDLLNQDGVLHYITTNYWVTADSALKLRRYLKKSTSILRMVNLDNYKLFKDAKGMHNLIFSISPKKNLDCKINVISDEKSQDLSLLYKTKYSCDQSLLYAENDNLLLYENPHYKTILDKIMDKGKFNLSHYVNINQGIVSGADKVSPSMLEKKLSQLNISDYNIKLGDPVFVHKEPGPLKPWMKAFYKNSHIKPYKVDISNHQWILYLTDEEELSSHDLPFQYLKAFKEVLEARRETKVGRRKWYALQWYRNQNIFESKKIVTPQRSRMNVFAYVEEPFYASADVYFLTGQPLKALVGILNSKLIFFWLYTRGKRKGKDLELYAKPLSQIPMLDFKSCNLIDLEALVNQYLLKEDPKILEMIDWWVYDAYGLIDDEIKLIEALYEKRRRKDDY